MKSMRMEEGIHKNEKLFVLFLIIVIISFFIYFFNISIQTEEQKVVNTTTQIERGIYWLLTTDAPFYGGSTYLIKKINEVCNLPALDDLWNEKIKEDLRERLFFYEIYKIPYNYSPEDCANALNNISGFGYFSDFVLCESIYCDHFDSEKIINDIDSIEEDDGFNSTHKLFSLLIVKDKKCYGESILNERIDKLAKELIIAEDSSEFDFIYAERAAFIGLAGYEIKQEWIDNILSVQRADGSWENDTHTTSLALLAIIQKNKRCN